MRTGFIDWIGEKLTIYVFEKKGGKYTLINSASINAEAKVEVSTINSLIKNRIEHTYLSVPVSLMSIRELILPFTDRDKIRDVIPYELEGLLLGDTNDYSTDHIVIESSKNNSKALTISIEKTKLKDIIGTFSEAGLEPKAITSIDLRLSKGNTEMLLKNPVIDEGIRREAIIEELEKPSINLRQNELAYKGDIDRAKKSFRIAAVLALILLATLSADIIVKFVSFKKENTSLAKETNTLYRDAFPEDKKIVDAVRQFKGNLNTIEKKKAIFSGVSSLNILLNIARLKNQNITLYEFSTDGKNVSLKGVSTSFEDVDSFKVSLSSSFVDVRVVDSKTSADKKVKFTITMRGRVI